MTPQEINIAVSDACGPRLFVINKPIRGYYRWNACGYTDSIEEAWKVTEEVGRKHCTGPAYANEPDKILLEPAPITNYFGGLNAIREAMATLTEDEQLMFTHHVLCQTVWTGKYPESHKPSESEIRWALVNATAATLAEAFLRTKGLWRDS